MSIPSPFICWRVSILHPLYRNRRHSALKVVKSAGRYAETARDEIKLLSRVSSFSPTHPGRSHIVSFLDSFYYQGPEASHVCIVFEPLGENLLAMIERNKKKGVPRALVKMIAKQILLGLQYLHDECDLVHTDIKPENIREFFLSNVYVFRHYFPCSLTPHADYSRCLPILLYPYLKHREPLTSSPYSNCNTRH